LDSGSLWREVVADDQKNKFRADPKIEGNFINVDLWFWSRHPNYSGEIVLRLGIVIIALPVLSGWQWLTTITRVFYISF